MSIDPFIKCIKVTLPTLPRQIELAFIYPYSTFSGILDVCAPNFIKIAQATQFGKLVNRPICYIGILKTLPLSTQRNWVVAYLRIQYFKSANEEPVYQVSSKLRSMSTGLFVICILRSLTHPALSAWISAYLPPQYFKSASEEHVYQVFSKSRSISNRIFVTCGLGILAHPVLRDCVKTNLPLLYFKLVNKETVYRIL
ncbi:hypothetical protein AVEN_234336-1 [Araneus ventricosus]|uniref:Uncharacterized protein n=1 Tax=Araneus ventricosus TaxID=182803 RepID=A0A4Y2A8B5_ARAVE|nr:hypothetical protein AVEN_234336-1 [Araneus ventricosus]